MRVYIGVDLHVRTQTVCWCDTTTGEQQERMLDHERDDVRAFYVQFVAPAVVGVEGSGYSLWFHRLIEGTGHQLVVGDAQAIRQFARRRQKNDRRDARSICCCTGISPSCMFRRQPAATYWRCCGIATGWCGFAPCCGMGCRPWR